MSPVDPHKFFLGRLVGADGKETGESLLYKPEDLNTHCVITGMTGSGKTGLGIVLLEEFALKNIPAVIIDPKGDLVNLCLHFPELRGEDFEPWIDPEAPARLNKGLSVLADETAEKWREGLERWGYAGPDLDALNRVDYTVFTPGSTIANPINILSTYDPPQGNWDEGDENIRELISTSVTALLDLVGYSNIDPIQSREHILLANIIEHYWNQNKSIQIEDMINAIDQPPFEKLGALPIDRMYPPKDRFRLAMALNNFLASPSFQNWKKGPALDIGSMLYTEDGRARFNIFYIQHLSDHERMFFVTMLYSQVEAWMRTQPGTGNLRLGVYFDEISGYLPATGRPASHGVILRLLKQARAFGVSLILSSQNPIDFDYKALSNAGTWFVGHLQTEQDKNRLIDGLTTTEGQIDRTQANRLISSLGKREFLYMNVHEPGLKVFTTRWALNYLAGPVTRNRLPMLVEFGLSREAGEVGRPRRQDDNEEETEEMANETKNDGTKPEIAATIGEYYLRTAKSPRELDSDGALITYVPAWFAQAEYRITQRKYNLDLTDHKAALIEDEDIRGTTIRWSDYMTDPIEGDRLSKRPESDAVYYASVPGWMLNASSIRSRESDFIDSIYRDGRTVVYSNEELGVYGDSKLSEKEFIELCKAKVDEASKAEKDKLTKAYQTTVDRLETKIRKAAADVSDKEDKVKSKNIEKIGAVGEFALSLLQGRRRSVSSSINKFGQSTNAGNALEKATIVLEELTESLERETESYKDAIAAVEAKWSALAEKYSTVSLSPMKKDIFVDYFGILWLPYYTDSAGKLVRAYQAAGI